MPRSQREKEEKKSQIKLSPKQVPESVGEAMVCFALAPAGQVVVEPNGCTRQNGCTKQKLTVGTQTQTMK